MCPSLHFLPMNLFELLVLTHFIADWIFQTSRGASRKHEDNFVLFNHAWWYTVFFAPIFVWKMSEGLSWYYATLLILLLLFSHAFLDKRKFEMWVLKKVKGIEIWTDGYKVCPYFFDKDGHQKDLDMGLFWILLITIDQIFHIIILAFIAMVM